MGDDREGDQNSTRSRVTVVTQQREFVGFLHTITTDRRETDVLNDEKSFIHMTEVVLRVKDDMPKKVPFVAVNKANIICVIPDESSD